VTELTPTGSAIVFSTFYGGSDANCSGGSSCIGIFGETGANAIAVDATGAVVIAGNTSASNLPVTAGTPGQTCRCNSNIPTSNSAGFVAKFPAGGKQLAWATYVNPSAINSLIVANSVSIRAVALDAGGNVIIGGAAPYAYSTTASSVQPTDPDGPPSMNSPYAGFVAKYSSSGQQILFSTFMGGGFAATATALPGVTALAVDTQGGIWLTGNSAPSELPFVAGTPLLGTSYVIGLSSDGTHLIGGFTAPAGAAGQDIVIGPQGNVATLGITGSILSVSTGQMPAIAGIASSAGFQVSGQVAPYELISLYGYGIGISAPLNGQIANGVLGNSLGGVQVLFDGIAAPLLYAGPNQINAIVPGEIAGHATTVLQVVAANLGFTTTTQSLPLFVVSSQPGIFATAPPPQTVPPVYLAVALNQDGTVNSATNPALPGSIMTVWATGSGVPNIPEMDGRIAGTTLLHPPAAAVSILSNASGGGSFDSLDVLYAGDAPDLVAGVIQINFQLPVNAGHGVTEIVEIQLQVGNAASSVCGIYVK